MTACCDAMKHQGRQRRQSGVALVTTVIVVAVLAVVGVAFMQSTSIDRLSSRTVADYYRAQLAAEAGLADFQAMLAQIASTNDFAVVTLTDGDATNMTVLVQPQTNGEVRVFPLFSRSNSASGLLATPPFNSAQLLAAANSAGATTNLNPTFVRFGGTAWPATNADALVLGAQFVNSATNTNGIPAAQFAYVVADDCAKLNLATAGTNYVNAARTNPLPSAFPGEIAVYGVGANTLAAADYNKFKELPESMRSGIVLPSVFTSTIDRKNKARFYTSHQGQAFDLIPAGYFDDARTNFTVFADAGKFKYDLNNLATNGTDARSNAFQIADIIASNLTNFYKRDPSLTNAIRPASDSLLRYNRRISAAIVDYIDSDSITTSITDDEPAGKELLAYPFQIAERYDWTQTSEVGQNSWDVTIKHTLFVELWNPHTKAVSGDFSFELETKREFQSPTNNPNGSVVNALIPTLGAGKIVAVSLNPNELKSYEIGDQSITVRIINTSTNPANEPARSLNLGITSSTNLTRPQPSLFRAFWDGHLYDRTASYNSVLFNSRAAGLEKSSLSFSAANTTSTPRWSCNVGQSEAGTTWRRVVADPRHNYINNYVWPAASYTEGTLRWQGASTYETNSPLTQLFAGTWAYRDTMRALNVGASPTGSSVNPPSILSTYVLGVDSDNAPFVVLNEPMLSVAELGHIYDPAHLDDSGAVTPTGGSPGSVYSSGGGRTLRIGQPEFNYLSYTQGGQRALNLLDIFTVRSNNATTNVATSARYAGLNINTAPTEVLAALFYNLSPVTDKGLTNGNTISLSGATNIATSIVAGRPYYSASDMHRFMDALVNGANFDPPIPNSPIAASSLNVLDRGREEIFRRAYDSLDTKSGAFRFYGVGRALSPTGEVLSEAGLEAWIELRSTTNTAGEPFLRPVVTQRKFL
jgi:hypothetical protein